MANKELLYIEWLDHYTEQGWHPDSLVDMDATKVKSVGYKIGENKDFIVLAASHASESGNGGSLQRMFIIKNNIIKKKKLYV